MKPSTARPEEWDDDWPKGTVAPCRPDGEVLTVDYDSKEAACFCPIRCCIVDNFNNIIGDGIDLRGKRGKEAYNPRPSKPSEDSSKTSE
jgi:hypothetical protein